MNKKILFGRSINDFVLAASPVVILCVVAVILMVYFVAPAPPHKIVLSTGTAGGDYQAYGKIYAEILSDDNVQVELRPSSGAAENFARLKDPNSGVDVAFVQDGIGTQDEANELSSLGSLYYEPLWIFYRGNKTLTQISQLQGLRIGVGVKGSGNRVLALRILKVGGVLPTNTRFEDLDTPDMTKALSEGRLDAALIVAGGDNRQVHQLAQTHGIHLMSLDHAEAIARQMPYLHHVVLPRGGLAIKKDIPHDDIQMVAPTATLLARDSMHPALVYLLLKAAAQEHGEPGLFEKRGEFPIDKDYEFVVRPEAKGFYKSGIPFWQRYFPFWLANMAERFLLLVIPLLAVAIPVLRLVPKILSWRVRSRIYRHYGELKHLETQVRAAPQGSDRSEFIQRLDAIEERVNALKVPLEFSDFVYSLRGHIHYVRGRVG